MSSGMADGGFVTLAGFTCFYCLPGESPATRFQCLSLASPRHDRNRPLLAQCDKAPNFAIGMIFRSSPVCRGTMKYSLCGCRISPKSDPSPQQSASSDPSANHAGLIPRESHRPARFYTARVIFNLRTRTELDWCTSTTGSAERTQTLRSRAISGSRGRVRAMKLRAVSGRLSKDRRFSNRFG
jgi:hypothetical protein